MLNKGLVSDMDRTAVHYARYVEPEDTVRNGSTGERWTALKTKDPTAVTCLACHRMLVEVGRLYNPLIATDLRSKP